MSWQLCSSATASLDTSFLEPCAQERLSTIGECVLSGGTASYRVIGSKKKGKKKNCWPSSDEMACKAWWHNLGGSGGISFPPQENFFLFKVAGK